MGEFALDAIEKGQLGFLLHCNDWCMTCLERHLLKELQLHNPAHPEVSFKYSQGLRR